MLDWKPEYVALLNRLYWTHVLKEASNTAYLRANAEIGRAARVRPLTVERWIMGERSPDPEESERLLRWAARVGWWEWDEENRGGRRYVTLAEKLSKLIRENKRK